MTFHSLPRPRSLRPPHFSSSSSASDGRGAGARRLPPSVRGPPLTRMPLSGRRTGEDGSAPLVLPLPANHRPLSTCPPSRSASSAARQVLPLPQMSPRTRPRCRSNLRTRTGSPGRTPPGRSLPPRWVPRRRGTPPVSVPTARCWSPPRGGGVPASLPRRPDPRRAVLQLRRRLWSERRSVRRRPPPARTTIPSASCASWRPSSCRAS
mmetsp:Transcript_54903/g.164378  ORF Transcript_54903/g.164378 Transcript_54903/m.164378 type:complete len:208 (-) Transcript_54903:1179-1802(-)